MFLQAVAMHFDKTFWMHRKHVWADYPTCNFPFLLWETFCALYTFGMNAGIQTVRIGNSSSFFVFKFRKLMLGGQVNRTNK